MFCAAIYRPTCVADAFVGECRRMCVCICVRVCMRMCAHVSSTRAHVRFRAHSWLNIFPAKCTPQSPGTLRRLHLNCRGQRTAEGGSGRDDKGEASSRAKSRAEEEASPRKRASVPRRDDARVNRFLHSEGEILRPDAGSELQRERAKSES